MKNAFLCRGLHKIIIAEYIVVLKIHNNHSWNAVILDIILKYYYTNIKLNYWNIFFLNLKIPTSSKKLLFYKDVVTLVWLFKSKSNLENK